MKLKLFISAFIVVVAMMLVCPAVAQTSSTSFILSEEGFDFLKLGANYKTIPERVEGLYDKVLVERDGVNIYTGAWDGEYSISFRWKKDEATLFSAQTDKNGNIVSFWIGRYPRIKVRLGGRLVSLTDKYSSLSSLPGANVVADGSNSYTTVGYFTFNQELDWEEGFTGQIQDCILQR